MQKNDKRVSGVHVGSASLILIFAVLCLTVFSTLAYVTASQEKELAEKSAQAMWQYYNADWQCEEMYDAIFMELQKGTSVETLAQIMNVQVKKEEGNYKIYYAVSIDENQQLQVVLSATEGKLLTEKWCATNTQSQTYEETLQVWDGE